MSTINEPPQSRTEALLQNMLGASNPLEPPQSRVEAILQNMLGANNALEPAQSRIEALLLEILAQGGGSSGGGTNLSAVDVFVGDYLSTTELTVTTGAVDRYRRIVVGG